MSSTVLAVKISEIFNKKDFSDVEFKIGKDDITFHGHKLILALRSPVFADMFYQRSQTNTILEIKNIEPQIFHKVLLYIYTDDVTFDSMREAHKICEAAETYSIDDLKLKCKEYISKFFIQPDRVCKIYEIATASHINMQYVKELCLETFKKVTTAVFQSQSFLEAKLSTVKAILECDVLAVKDETAVLEAVINWGEAQCELENQTPKNLRHFIEPLLQHIRFLTIPLEDIQKFIQDYDVLNSAEVFCLVLKLSNDVNNVIVPESLCSNTVKRMLHETTNDPDDNVNEDHDEDNSDQFYDCDLGETLNNNHELNDSCNTDQHELQQPLFFEISPGMTDEINGIFSNSLHEILPQFSLSNNNNRYSLPLYENGYAKKYRNSKY